MKSCWSQKHTFFTSGDQTRPAYKSRPLVTALLKGVIHFSQVQANRQIEKGKRNLDSEQRPGRYFKDLICSEKCIIDNNVEGGHYLWS